MADKAIGGPGSSEKQEGTERYPQRYKPGVCGNPGGRPKGALSLTKLLREALEKNTINGELIPEGKTAGERLIELAIANASKGNAKYFTEIINRIDGKLPDKVEIRDLSKLTDDQLRAIAEGAGGSDLGASSETEGEEQATV
jgi:hypothetical protein